MSDKPPYVNEAEALALAQNVFEAAKQFIRTLVNQSLIVGFRGTIDLASPVPTSFGAYTPTQNGTYTNFGGLVANLSEGETTFFYNEDGSFEKVVIPINLSTYLTTTDFNPYKLYIDTIKGLIQQVQQDGVYYTDSIGAVALSVDNAGLLSSISAYFKTVTADELILSELSLNSLFIGGARVTSSNDYNFVITDSLGFIGLNVDSNKLPGGVAFKSIDGYTYVITDSLGFIGWNIDNSDISGGSIFPKPSIIADWTITNNAGQSNSLGIDANRFTYPATLANAYKLSGYGYFEDPQDWTQLEPLIEDGTFESPAFGMASMQLSTLQSQNGFNPDSNDFTKLMIVPGVGGTSIEGMMRGTASWTKMLTQVTNIRNLANAAGKTCYMDIDAWTQGEANITSSTADYKAKLIQRNTELNADIKAITGAGQPYIKTVFYQLSLQSAQNIQQAFFELFQEQPDKFHLACPTYQFSWHIEDGIHFLNGEESFWYGLHQGYAQKRIVYDKFAWLPVYPTRYTAQGSIVELEFHVPEGDLVLDTTLVTNPGNFGFNVRRADNSEITVNSVTLVRGNTVRLVCAEAVVAGCKVSYAYKNGTANTNGRTTGARGCLRDQQGDSVSYNFNAKNYRIDNYCTIFNHTF